MTEMQKKRGFESTGIGPSQVNAKTLGGPRLVRPKEQHVRRVDSQVHRAGVGNACILFTSVVHARQFYLLSPVRTRRFGPALYLLLEFQVEAPFLPPLQCR